MPNTRHETFACTFDQQLTDKINDAFKNRHKIYRDSSSSSNSGGGGGGGSEEGDTTVLIHSSGSADVTLVPEQASLVAAGNRMSDNAIPHKLQPDAGWRRQGLDQPGLVVEIAYTQPKEECIEHAKFYLGITNGEVRCVIIVDLRYKGLLASVSVVVGDWEDEGMEPDEGGIIHLVWRVKDQVLAIATSSYCPLTRFQ
jgi:hypothetical protein